MAHSPKQPILGTFDHAHREVTVVGAGISGLLIAEALDRVGFEVTLLEAESRTGGLIRTGRTAFGLAEGAAHSFLASPEVLALCERLGVELAPVRPESGARFILRDGKQRKFPLTFSEAVRTFVRAYFVLADPQATGRESLAEWATRHLGISALRFLFTPFVRGIYGANPSEIQIGAAFPALRVPRGHSLISFQLARFRRRFFGLEPKRPRSKMMAPKGGMESLVSALSSRLSERLGNRYRIGQRASGPELMAARNLVLTVPAFEAAKLIDDQDPRLAAALAEVRYTPLICVTIIAARAGFPTPPQGVGVLMADGEHRRSLGVLFNSSAFPNRVVDEAKLVSLTMMLGGSTHPELLRLRDGELRDVVETELAELFGLAPTHVFELTIHRWERAVPRYDAGLMDVWETALEGWCARPGRLLFGNYTGQVSIRGMIEACAAIDLPRA